jgi:hypothetical protein
MNHLENERHHAKLRAHERFDLDMAEVDAIPLLIQAGKSKFIKRQSRRISVHRVWMKEQSIEVAYDSKTKQIVTLLDPTLKDVKRLSRKAERQLRIIRSLERRPR